MTTRLASTLSRAAIKLAARERLLLCGNPGKRKTTALVELAQLFPDQQVFLIDANDGMRKIVDGHFGGFEHLPNLYYYPVDLWDKPNMEPDDPKVGIIQAYEEIKSLAQPGDFVGMDTVGELYDLARDKYVLDVYDMTYDAYVFKQKLRKGADSKVSFGGLDGDEWGMIKGIYDSVVWHSFHRLPCNVIATSMVRQVMMQRKRDPVTRQETEQPLEKGLDSAFVRLGMAPVTEKRLPSEVDTVLYLDSVEKTTREGLSTTWTAKYVTKDRGVNMSQVRQFEFDTSTPFWIAYAESKGLDPSKAPGARG